MYHLRRALAALLLAVMGSAGLVAVDLAVPSAALAQDGGVGGGDSQYAAESDFYTVVLGGRVIAVYYDPLTGQETGQIEDLGPADEYQPLHPWVPTEPVGPFPGHTPPPVFVGCSDINYNGVCDEDEEGGPQPQQPQPDGPTAEAQPQPPPEPPADD